MDKELRELLVEIARGILRVLDEPEGRPVVNKRRPGVVASMNDALSDFVLQTDLAIAPAPARPIMVPERGDVVRVWSGDRYETGTVQSICRGTPRRIVVTIARGEGRRVKRVRVESAKAEILKKKEA